MDGGEVIVACGPSRPGCKCNCPESCEHQWDGEVEEFHNGWSATCSKCGMSAMNHDLWVAP